MSFKQQYVINNINTPPPSGTDVAEYYQEINTHIDIRLMIHIQDNLCKPATERSNQSGFTEDDGVAVASGWILFLTPSQQCQTLNTHVQAKKAEYHNIHSVP